MREERVINAIAKAISECGDSPGERRRLTSLADQYRQLTGEDQMERPEEADGEWYPYSPK